jgi:hypothetical protein
MALCIGRAIRGLRKRLAASNAGLNLISLNLHNRKKSVRSLTISVSAVLFTDCPGSPAVTVGITPPNPVYQFGRCVLGQHQVPSKMPVS